MPRTKRSRMAMSPVHANAAAIDIGATLHIAAVGPDRDPEPVGKLGTFTGDLHRLADWFKQCGVSTIAMESTGVYWIPVFEILEQLGFTVVLVNARDAKRARPQDRRDRRTMAAASARVWAVASQLRPERRIAALRDYLRQRERLLDYAAWRVPDIIQKALMQMNLQLHHVVSDITGATGMRIIRAVVAGERNPVTLAALRDQRCKDRPRRSDRHWSAMTGRNTSSPWRRPWSCMTPTWPRLMPATSGLRRS